MKKPINPFLGAIWCDRITSYLKSGKPCAWEVTESGIKGWQHIRPNGEVVKACKAVYSEIEMGKIQDFVNYLHA